MGARAKGYRLGKERNGLQEFMIGRRKLLLPRQVSRHISLGLARYTRETDIYSKVNYEAADPFR